LFATTVCIIALIAFFIGRGVEERALAAKARVETPASTSFPAAIEPVPPSHRRLAVEEILGLPFADFYEALRSAPGEAREKWASELVTMPEGPRRTAAVSGFYKLLVQFDPAAAVQAIGEIEDVRLQSVALGSAVDATPGFAMKAMAELSLSLEGRTVTSSKRDHLSDVLLEWMLIDAPAVAQFIDDHPEAESYDNYGARQFLDMQFLSAWAALDPKAAKQWMEKKAIWEDAGWEARQGFVEGWYENDRAAAVSYTLANFEDPAMDGAMGVVVRGLYLDSKEEAGKFIESLPEDKRADAIERAFHNLILGDEKGTGDTMLNPRAVASWIIEFPPAYWNGTLSRVFWLSSSGAEDMLPWIEQLPPSVREAVAAKYAPPLGKSTSEAIMPVLQVADPTLWGQLLRATLKNQNADFDEARVTIASAAISSDQKNHLLQIIAAVEAEKDHD
jgi:hypothetical protein